MTKIFEEKVLGIKSTKNHPFYSGSEIVIVSDRNRFEYRYYNAIGVYPEPFHDTFSKNNITGKELTYVIPSTILNKMLIQSRKDKIIKIKSS
jgi:hypothetical protein